METIGRVGFRLLRLDGCSESRVSGWHPLEFVLLESGVSGFGFRGLGFRV